MMYLIVSLVISSKLQDASCKNGYPLSVHRLPRIIGSSFQSEYLFFVLGQSTTRRIRGKGNEARGKKIKISSLFRPLASSQAKDGSMIWDEGLRTTLHSVQRNFWCTAALQGEIPCRYPEQEHFRAGSTG